MSKRKTEFHGLRFINPFDDEHRTTMVYKKWRNHEELSKWRKENANFLKDPKMLELLDIDEIITQWEVFPTERQVNPDTCIMVFKELAVILRLIDAEHQDAILREGKNLPGIVYSDNNHKYMYIYYDLDATDAKKGTKVLMFDTEEEAYQSYSDNRNSMIDRVASQALMDKLIDPEIYMKYFNTNEIKVRDYSYYKN